nr:leukotriene A-4 hydrolase-like isoform X1 [Chrysemys picta bellii]
MGERLSKWISENQGMAKSLLPPMWSLSLRWLRLCIQAKWEEAIPLALKMATEQGRLKFTCPLFRDLYNFEKSRDQAVSSFMQHRVCMHPVAAMLVAKDLKVDQGQTA